MLKAAYAYVCRLLRQLLCETGGAEMETKKKSPAIFYTYYFVIFLGQAIHGSFLTMYLNGAGMDEATIGLVNGIIQIISLAAFPMWGNIADRASSKNKVLIIGMIMSIGLLVAFSYAKSVFMLAVVMVAYSVVYYPLAGIYETISMEHVAKNGWNYSPIRMSGTIGYAVMAVIAGFWLSEKEDLIFPIYIITMVIAAICALALPKTKGTAPLKKKESGRIRVCFWCIIC